jgi:rare lipoprotein A
MIAGGALRGPAETVALLTSFAAALSLAACSKSGSSRSARSDSYNSKYGVAASPRVAEGSSSIPKGGGTYKIGTPYRIEGRWYTPVEDPGYDRTGTASWYGADFHGRKTANGEIFDMNALTAAHPTLPIPSYAYVTNLANGRTVLVRINDRGPYANNRIIDLSRHTAQVLGTEAQGLAEVRVRYAGRAPLDGNDAQERAFLASQPWSRGIRLAGDGSGGACCAATWRGLCSPDHT